MKNKQPIAIIIAAGMAFLLLLNSCSVRSGGDLEMPSNSSLPPIDLAAPEEFATATFASG